MLTVKKGRRRKYIDYLQNCLLACIPVVGFLLFTLIPMFLSGYMSFLDLKSPLLNEGSWIGFANYHTILFGEHAARFYRSFLNVFIFWLNVPLSMMLGIGISYILNTDVKGKKFFRLVYFIPYVCSLVAVVLMFQMMYETNYGIFNTVLRNLGIEKIGWITTPQTFMWSAMFMQTWKNVGFCVILFSAAMANVDGNLYEACYLDGGSAGAAFRKITLPAISPITYYLLTVCTIGALQTMGEVQVLAAVNGNNALDGAHLTPVLLIYDMAFTFPNRYGFGISAAASWILVFFILILTRISAVLSKRWVHYEF